MLQVLFKYYSKISTTTILVAIGLIIVCSSIVLNYFNRPAPFTPQNNAEKFKAVSVELISLQQIKAAQIQSNQLSLQPSLEVSELQPDVVSLAQETEQQNFDPAKQEPTVIEEQDVVDATVQEISQGIANDLLPTDDIDNQLVVGDASQDEQDHAIIQLVAAQIQEKIWDKWYLPNGISQIVGAEVVLRLSETGEVVSIEFTRFSGSSAVDLSIEHAIHNAAPFTIINKLPSNHLRESFKWLVIEFSPDNFLNS